MKNEVLYVEDFMLCDYLDFDVMIRDIRFIMTKRCPQSWKYETKYRAEYGLLYIVSGASVIEYPGMAFEAKKGDLVFLEKDSSYMTTAKKTEGEPYEFIVISFDFEDENAVLPFRNMIGNFPNLYGEFKKIEDIWVSKSICYKLLVRSYLTYLLYNLIRHHFDKSNVSDNSFRNIRVTADYINNYYDKKISIEDLTQMSGYSTSYYRKQFKKFYGESPIDYLNHIRTEKAKNLILSRVYRFEEIAQLSGFTNVYYFSRMFKKITGESPSSFKNSLFGVSR